MLRSNSGLLVVEDGAITSQNTFSSLVSTRPQINNINMLGNVSNLSSLMGGQGQSFGNVGSVNVQRGSIDSGAELDPLANAGYGMSYSGGNPSTSRKFQTQQLMMLDQSLSQQNEPQTFQHSQQQFSVPPKTQGQHQLQTSPGPVKLESQIVNEQLGLQNTQQQFQSVKNVGHVKLDGIPSTRSLGPMKTESQHTGQQPLFLQQQLQQQYQQQQFLQNARQPSQAAATQFLQHQPRISHLQQLQQQQQLLKNSQQIGQFGQQIQQQNLPARYPMKSVYEPGIYARRVMGYICHQRQRPDDNNIDFWRKFVNEYFAPNAKKRWCLSMYGGGRQIGGVFPQDVLCGICNRNPGRGFEATYEVLPRLFKIKYESGTLEELLYVDMPREHQNSSGQIVLNYAKAIQESVFEQLRVVREGQLRIVLSPDLKICSWEFCARHHEELIPRRLLAPQVTLLGAAAQKCKAVAQSASPSVPELQKNCNMFLSPARHLAKTLEVPLVNDFGYTKRYVRCLQISEVFNCMKDLIDYSRQTGIGPMESLAKFPRREGSTSGVPPDQSELPEEQSKKQRQLQPPTTLAHQNTGNFDQTSLQACSMELPTSNGVESSRAISALHQNSVNLRQQQISMHNVGSPYGNSNSTFQSPTHSSSGNNPSLPEISVQQQRENPELSNGQSSLQKMIQEMMSKQGSGGGIVGRVHGSLGSDGKHATGVAPAMGAGLSRSQTAIVNGLRAAMSSGGRVGMGAMNNVRSMNLQQQQPQELSHQMVNGLGPANNGFNSLRYD